MKYFLLILSFLLGLSVFADEPRKGQVKKIDQATLCCVYLHYTQTQNLENVAVTDSTVTILEIGELVAKYGDLAAYKGKAPEGFSISYLNGDPRANDGITVYQGYPQENMITVREALLPNFYLYEETPALEWKIVEGSTTLLGYPCEKATATYAGRTWTAYFSQDIPSTRGPWKLSGLPGLILKAESTDGVHRFVAQALFNVEAQDMVLDKTEKDVTTTRDRFIKLRNRLKTDAAWAKNAAYYLNSKDIREIWVVKDKNEAGLAPSLNINGISLPPTGGFGHLYQSLELN